MVGLLSCHLCLSFAGISRKCYDSAVNSGRDIAWICPGCRPAAPQRSRRRHRTPVKGVEEKRKRSTAPTGPRSPLLSDPDVEPSSPVSSADLFVSSSSSAAPPVIATKSPLASTPPPDYTACLARMSTIASIQGVAHAVVVAAVAAEGARVTSPLRFTTPDHINVARDEYSTRLLRRSQDLVPPCPHDRCPVLASGDGNCLFNAVSIALAGIQK